MSSATKQKSSAGKNVLIFFIVFIILEGLILFGIGRIFKNKDVTLSIAGYSLYLMDSGAMGDSVPQGSLVIASNMTPSVDRIGEAVVCENVPGIGTSVFRLYDINQTEDKTGVDYTIYQENNPNKLYKVKASNIVGTASSYYMTAGKVLNFVTSKFGFIVCLAVPLFLLVVLELIIAIATGGSYEEDEEEEEDFEEKKENVSLDDFLFGGQNEGEQIANHRKQEEESVDPQTFSKSSDEAPTVKAEKEPEITVPEVKPVETASEAVIAPAEPTVQPMAETAPKASSFGSDESLTLDTEAAARPARRPVRRRPRTTAPRVQAANKTNATSASQSLEDLMKLMEQEQEKLKNQINNK